MNIIILIISVIVAAKCYEQSPDQRSCSGQGRLTDKGECYCHLGYRGHICEISDDITNMTGQIRKGSVLLVVGSLLSIADSSTNRTEPTGYYWLARHLRDELKYKVTVLVIDKEALTEGDWIERWQLFYDEECLKNHRIEVIESLRERWLGGGGTRRAEESAIVMREIRELSIERGGPFELIVFGGSQGLGFFTMEAERNGLICYGSHFVVIIDALPGKDSEGDTALVTDHEKVVSDFFLEQTVPNADTVIFTDIAAERVVRWGRKWELPPSTIALTLPQNAEDLTSIDYGWRTLLEDCQRRGARPCPAISYSLLKSQMAWSPSRNGTDYRPMVSVVVPNNNRGQLLELLIQSYERQTMQDFQLVIVDDGSNEPYTVALLHELKQKWEADPSKKQRGWTILFQKARDSPGFSRNAGAKYASGKYLVFQDDDDVAKDEQLNFYLRVAEVSGAEVVTTAHDRSLGNEYPKADTPAYRFYMLGGARDTTLLYNYLGASNFLVRRDYFLRTHQFENDNGLAIEDFGYHVEVVLSQSGRMITIPEPLYWYRQTSTSRGIAKRPPGGRLRIFGYNRKYWDTMTPYSQEVYKWAFRREMIFESYRKRDAKQKRIAELEAKRQAEKLAKEAEEKAKEQAENEAKTQNQQKVAP